MTSQISFIRSVRKKQTQVEKKRKEARYRACLVTKAGRKAVILCEARENHLHLTEKDTDGNGEMRQQWRV